VFRSEATKVRRQIKLGAALMVLASTVAFGAHSQEMLDATVENSSGSSTRLSTLWKKPTLLFYEDRDSTQINQHVKEALFAAGKARGLLDSVTVIAVANVAAYDWFPARNFVLAAVRDVEKKFNLPVYLDFKGQLAAPPWSLPAKSSTVVLLDAGGVIRTSWKGRLSEADVSAMFERLAALLDEPKR
jgi:hypothetical protein